MTNKESDVLHEPVENVKEGEAAVALSNDAQRYLNHLLVDGSKEGDSGTALELPPWFDEQLFKQGQSYMNKYRFVIFSGMLSGLVAVLAIPSILRILQCTRQSSTPATAYRRYLRTILHTNAWYDHSITDKGSKIWKSLRAVRKAHTQASHASHRIGAGKITQKDLALTQFGFIGFLALGDYRIQMDDAGFRESMAHMWRVLGYLLGIKDEYNVCGRNWTETKERLHVVMRQVYVPALQNTGKDFECMTKALLEGLWPANTALTVGSFLFFTKRLAYVPGYEYYDFDYLPGTKRDAQQRLYYYDMGWWDRFLVSYGLFMVTYLHKYAIVRQYLNFRTWLNLRIIYYLPYLAFWKYGLKNAYVRIFDSNDESLDFEFHLKSD